MLHERVNKCSKVEITIAQLGMPKRACNALLHAGIRTLEDASEWSDRDLLSLPHFGKASLASLRGHIGRKLPVNASSVALSALKPHRFHKQDIWP